MGNILKAYQYEQTKDSNLMKPVIFCNPTKDLSENAVSVNIPLAKELQKQSNIMMRTMELENNLQKVIESLGEEPTVKDFDVLFNPSYKTDVLKSLISVCRKKPFRVIWPGRYEDGKLFYAEEGYRDYKVFNITDYDVTVII